MPAAALIAVAPSASRRRDSSLPPLNPLLDDLSRAKVVDSWEKAKSHFSFKLSDDFPEMGKIQEKNSLR
jgi:hypothetical protein